MSETPKPRVTFRLSPEEFAKLEASLPAPHVGKETSDTQAGYLLGIQMVLSKIRHGYVIG